MTAARERQFAAFVAPESVANPASPLSVGRNRTGECEIIASKHVPSRSPDRDEGGPFVEIRDSSPGAH